jgi:hypothetical protein
MGKGSYIGGSTIIYIHSPKKKKKKKKNKDISTVKAKTSKKPQEKHNNINRFINCTTNVKGITKGTVEAVPVYPDIKNMTNELMLAELVNRFGWNVEKCPQKPSIIRRSIRIERNALRERTRNLLVSELVNRFGWDKKKCPQTIGELRQAIRLENISFKQK